MKVLVQNYRALIPKSQENERPPMESSPQAALSGIRVGRATYHTTEVATRSLQRVQVMLGACIETFLQNRAVTGACLGRLRDRQ